jgi:hypothetical protein
MTFIGPSQREQSMTSKTRFSRVAWSRRYADRGGDGFDDASVDVVADGDTGAGPSIAVDGPGVGGARRGAGTTFVRRQPVGANTPWNLVRFAYTGGIKARVGGGVRRR